DAKGPLAAFILAAAKAAPSLTNTNIVVIGAVEEEAGSRGARHIVGKFQPDYAIVGEPSGWDGISLGYKGSLLLSYSLSRPAKHSAADGAAPLEEAVGFWNRLTAWASEINRGKTRRFETLDLSLREINSSGDGFVQRVEMAIGVRMPVGFDVAAFKEAASAWADGAEVSFQNEEVPFRAGKNNPLVRAFLRAIRALGGKPRFKLKTGTSDMNVVGPMWGCPIVAYGPGDSSLDHTPNEYIEIEEYLRAIEVLERVLTDTCDLVSQEHQLQI
ncbi:MAG: M20/M25/M40 family metallo-hydrolase, partial [Nitrospinota bacterium]